MPSTTGQKPKTPWQNFLDATLYNPRINPLSGITKGMATTFDMSVEAWFDGKATLEYPEMKKEIADRYRGAHELLLEPGGGLICISCNLCAEACPVDCIEVTFEMDGKTRVLDQYNVDLSKCLFCDLCVEACPTYCIIMTKKFEYSDYSRWEDSALYITREKGIERSASINEFRDMVLRSYQPKYTELAEYFSEAEIVQMGLPATERSLGGTSFTEKELATLPDAGLTFKPRKREEYKKPAPPKPVQAAGAVRVTVAAPPQVAMDYGDLGKEAYEVWAKDDRKASQLNPEERKAKGGFAKLQKMNNESGATAYAEWLASGASAGGGVSAAPAGPAPPQVAMDYGELGKDAYEIWAKDDRKASQLSGDERKAKGIFARLKKTNDESGATAYADWLAAGGGSAASGGAAFSGPMIAYDYGELGRERYEFWAADERKASQLSGDERKEKGIFARLKKGNDERGANADPDMIASGGSSGGGAPAVAPVADNLDYGELGAEKYHFWAADTRKASELNPDERKEKGLYMKIKRQNEGEG